MICMPTSRCNAHERHPSLLDEKKGDFQTVGYPTSASHLRFPPPSHLREFALSSHTVRHHRNTHPHTNGVPWLGYRCFPRHPPKEGEEIKDCWRPHMTCDMGVKCGWMSIDL